MSKHMQFEVDCVGPDIGAQYWTVYSPPVQKPQASQTSEK